MKKLFQGVTILLFILFFIQTTPVSAASSDNGTNLPPSLHIGIRDTFGDNGTYIQNFLQTITQLPPPSDEFPDTISSPFGQTGDSSVPVMDRSSGPLPIFETAGAYIVFLLTFGLSFIFLFLLLTVGRRFTPESGLGGSRTVSFTFAIGYLGMGIITGFLSISILSFFSALFISGNLIVPVGITAFCVVYLALSSLLLSYASYSGRSYPLIRIFHTLFSLPLIFIAGMMHEQPSGLMGGMEMLLIFFTISAFTPIIQWYMTKKGGMIAPSSVTMVAGITSAPLRRGNRFPHELNERYMDAELVGSGGMALVFRARRREDGRIIAVKVPTRYDEVTGHSFLREMEIWKSLSHPNIVEIYAYNILPVPFVEMKYAPSSLSVIKKPMPIPDALRITRGIAEGLAYAHASGVIHRDIKPGNILIAEDGRPMITDWGLGKEIADRNETLFFAFSLDYASPEQISPGRFGRGDARIDIFQLGLVFYELLTGKKAFEGEGMGDVTFAILTNDPKPPSVFSERLQTFDTIVQKCLRKLPDERYQSIRDFISDINAVDVTEYL